jgi:8-oxo-dGTP diphosphatase
LIADVTDTVQMSDHRRYPARPVLGVGAVIFDAAGRVVLIKRGQPPLLGIWTLPGGAVEPGETLEEATIREIREETGLVIEVGPVVDLVEHIDRDDAGCVVYHFVIVDYLCRLRGGDLRATSDASAVLLADSSALGTLETTERTLLVIAKARAIQACGVPPDGR